MRAPRMHSKSLRYQSDFDRKGNMRKPFLEAGEYMAYSEGVEWVSPARTHLPRMLVRSE